MDDRSFFGSFMFNFFKPFKSTYKFDSQLDSQDYGKYEYPEGQENKGNHLEIKPEVSPRDSLLKPDKSKKDFIQSYSDSEKSENNSVWHWQPFGHSENEEFDMDRSDPFFSDSFSHNFHGFSDFNSIFRMMDEMFEGTQQFNGIFGDHHRNDFSIFSNVPFLDSKPFAEEKKDKDLDDSSGKDIASLLKEPPSYQQESRAQPAVSSSRFHSTSIVRIRRPDGVIEETRKYKNSEGREETEIIIHDPNTEGATQPIEPFTDGSLNSIFKKFPFSLF